MLMSTELLLKGAQGTVSSSFLLRFSRGAFLGPTVCEGGRGEVGDQAAGVPMRATDAVAVAAL